MNSESIMNSDVLDIVFEKRNKLYGAYTLRKFYNSRLIKSLGITLGAVTFLSAFTFIPERKVTFTASPDIIICTIGKIKPLDAKKQLPKQQIKSTQSSQKKLTTPAIADSTSKPDFLQYNKPTDITGAMNITIQGKEEPGIIGETYTINEGGGSNAKIVETPVDVTAPTENPEVEPAYPGGINALRKFLERNLVNPKEMEEGEMVSVNVKFVVGFDGKLQQFTVVKDGGNIFNEEVIRVLKRMPAWIPGKSKGQNVAVYFSIPIKFVPAD